MYREWVHESLSAGSVLPLVACLLPLLFVCSISSRPAAGTELAPWLLTASELPTDQLVALRECRAAELVDGETFDVLVEHPADLHAFGLTEPRAQQQVASAFRRLQPGLCALCPAGCPSHLSQRALHHRNGAATRFGCS